MAHPSRCWLAVGASVWLGCVAVACGSGSPRSELPDDPVLTFDDPSGAGGSAGAGGSGGNAVLSEGDRFLADYAGALCGMYEPCCQAEGLGFDAGGCTDWMARVTAAYSPDQFVPEAGAACLAAVADARAREPERCSSVPLFEQAALRSLCDQAFVAPAREGAPLLGDCLLAGDCAAAAGEHVICYGGSCVLETRGKLGDGPCYAGGNTGLQQQMFTCGAADGLYCDRGVNVCAERVGDGERCPYSNACVESAMCVGGACRALPDEGEPCLNGVPGAGGYCRSGACNSSTLVCGPGAAEGEACSETRKCAQGVCLDGSCARSDWRRSLNCVGRRY